MEMSDLLSLFLEEADEQLQKLDDGILLLEKDPHNLEILKEIFRAAHTLKGSSATMGLSDIAELTHAMENLLDPLRSGSITATPEIIDLLLASTDALRALIGGVSSGEKQDIDTDDLRKSLLAAVGGEQQQAVAAKPAKKTRAAKKSAVADCHIDLCIKILDNCLMPSVRAFMIYNALAKLGQVVSSNPPQDNLDDLQAGQVIEIVFNPVSCGRDEVYKAIHSLSEIELISDANEVTSPASDESVAAAERITEKTDSPKQAEQKPDQAAKATIQTVRVGVDRLDTLMNLVAELVIDRTRITQIESDLSLKYEGEELISNLGETAVHVGRVINELQEQIMKVRLLPVEQVFSRFPRMVRDLARKAGKDIDLVLVGQETELDRSILEEIVDPLTHLLRNAVDHGTQTSEERAAVGKSPRSTVTLAARQEENRIIIEVSDDGKGIDIERVKASALKKGIVTEDVLSRMSHEDALQLIFASGLSTAEKVTDVSGRGVGMDVVRNNIQGLSGTVEVQTESGKGTTFKISLPLTLAIIQALVTGVENRVFVIPLSAVVETFQCSADEVRTIEGRPAINFRGIVLPLINMGQLFPTSDDYEEKSAKSFTFVVVNTGALKVGLVVDKLIGEQEVVIKPLGSFFGDLKGIAGATILGDGRVALIVDVAGIGGLVNRRRYNRPAQAIV